MSGLTTQEVVDYYMTSKGSLTDYTTEDIYTVFITGAYVKLPIEVTMAVYKLLAEVKIRHGEYLKTRRVRVGSWTVMTKETPTSVTEKVYFDFKEELPVNKQDAGVYIAFLDHYITQQVDYVFRVEMETLRLKVNEYNKTDGVDLNGAMMRRYQRMMREVSEVGYWYLGKKETDKLLSKLTHYYKQQVNASSVHLGYHHEFDEDVVESAYTQYQKMRGRTRLNKGLDLPKLK